MRTIEIDNLILVEVPKDAKIIAIVSNGIEYITDNTYVAQYIDFNNRINEIIGLIETPNLNFNFDANNIKIPCTISCNQSDFRKGGKCDKNGCLGDNNSLLKTRIQRKIQDAGIELTGNLLLIKKLK